MATKLNGSTGTKGNSRLRDQLLIASGLTLLAFIVRMFWIDHPRLDQDEVFSLLYYRHSFAHHFDLHRTTDVHPPLHPVLLKIVIGWFGETRTAMRGISALLGALTIPALFLIGRNWASMRVAVLASLFLVLNPVQIFYGREMRAYAALSFCLLWATFFFLELVRRPDASTRVRAWLSAGFVLFLTLTFHLHYLSIAYWPLFGLAVLILFARDRDWRQFLWLCGALALATLLCIPQSIHFAGYAMGSGAARNAWIARTDFYVFYSNTLGAYPFPMITKPFIYALYAYGAYRMARRSVPLFAVTMVFVVVGPLLFALIGFFKPIYLTRSIQGFVLLSPLLLAFGIEWLRARFLVPAVLLLGAAHLAAARSMYPPQREPNPGEAIKAVQADRSGDTVFYDSMLSGTDDPEIKAYRVDARGWQSVGMKNAEADLARVERHLAQCAGAQSSCAPTTVIIEHEPLFLKSEGKAWNDGLDALARRYPVLSDEVVANFRFVRFE